VNFKELFTNFKLLKQEIGPLPQYRNLEIGEILADGLNQGAKYIEAVI
jgi:hypothetical protein